MLINFYTHAKKENSTAQPSAQPAASFDCLLKEPCSVLNPRITINRGAAFDPSGLNYCYIPDFNRYYYVSWSYIIGIWEASCTEDVLATYKDQIGSTPLYVVRSSAAYDGSIIDSEYPTKTTCTFQTITGTDPFVKVPAGGWYVIGVASSNLPNYGALTYYAIDDSNLLLLLQALNSDLVTGDNGFLDADCSLELQKALIDPFSYIKSCMWYPFDNLHDSPPIAGSLVAINVLGVDLGANGYFISSSTPFKNGTITLNLPDHPDLARGAYMNAAHRRIIAKLPPFGTFEIDPLVAANAAAVTCEYHIDCISGIATAEIKCGTHLISRIETRLGVPIQLAAVYQDLFSGAVNLGRGVVGGIASAFTGDVFGTLAGVTGGITDAMQSMRPALESIGSNGSFASLYGAPQLFVQFTYQVDEDINHFGKPLCQIRTPDSLGGYMLIRDGDVALPATRQENDQVKAYLEGGFYYE